MTSHLSTWSLARDFTHGPSTVTVRVNYQEIPPRKEGMVPLRHYSFEIGRIRDDGQFSRHFPVICTVRNGAVTLSEDDKVIQSLIDEARAWVREQKQERENEVIARRIEFEQAAAKRDRETPTMPGLKRLGKLDAAKRA